MLDYLNFFRLEERRLWVDIGRIAKIFDHPLRLFILYCYIEAATSRGDGSLVRKIDCYPRAC